MRTTVIRRYRSDNSLIALFPEIPIRAFSGTTGPGWCEAYHQGHGLCDVDVSHIQSVTRPVSRAEHDVSAFIDTVTNAGYETQFKYIITPAMHLKRRIAWNEKQWRVRRDTLCSS